VSDALPADYGVNACGPRARAGMTREQREWHARMASLPTYVHRKPEVVVDRAAAAAKAARTRGVALSITGTPRPASKPAAPAKPRGRQPTDRHGFSLRQRVDIVGGRYAGQVGRYDGSVDVTRVFVQTGKVRLSVMARFVRAAA
jgi:hypothetical protein